MNPAKAYDFLLRQHHDTACLGSTAALLHWDQRTYIPRKGHAHRAEQVAFLTGLVHERRTDPRIGEALAVLEAARSANILANASPNASADALAKALADPLDPMAVNLREWRRAYDRAVKLPASLAVALAKTASLAETAWEDMRPRNDWAGFEPHLAELLRLKRAEAEAVGYDEEPYDALLDEYEPGERAKRLEPIFAELKTEIVRLLDLIRGGSRQPDSAILNQPFDLDRQKEFVMAVLPAIGLDQDSSRVDAAAHPFSTMIGPGDVRLTTRHDANCLSDGLFGAVHEAGHAMYDLGLPVEHWGQPMSDSVSLGIHESQSRLWENLVARSRGFWKHFLPLAARLFPGLAGRSVDELYFAVNEARPSLIRTEADQLTYNLHILLRFELELAMMRGQLSVSDLPQAFNDKMRELLGLTPADFASGVMQDVHWSAGLIGYFPTYTLGNLCAAQFFAAAGRELGDLDEAFARGEFAPLLGWLRKRVHSQGMRHRPRDLVRVVTGEELSARPLLDHLEGVMRELYGV